MEGRPTFSRNVINVRAFGIKILEILWGGIPSYTPRSGTSRPTWYSPQGNKSSRYQIAKLRNVTRRDPVTSRVGLGFYLDDGEVCGLSLDEESITDLERALFSHETATQKDR